MRQIFDLEVQVWWEKPFWEYKICDSTSCRRVFSIEDVHGAVDAMNSASWEDFCCTDCLSETSYMYASEDFYEVMKEYVQWNVSMILLIWDEDTVEWFWILSQWTIESISNYEFQTRPWGLSPENLVSSLSQAIFWVEDASEEDVVCFHQIFVSKQVRDAAISYKLMQELFFLTAEVYSDLPVVWETLLDWRFYPVSRSMWFDDAGVDKYWYVIQYIHKYSSILKFLWENDWFKSFQSRLLHFRKYGRSRVDSSAHKWEKYYQD